VRFEFIQAENAKKTFPITVMCRALKVSSSGYYAWLSRDMSPQGQRREWLADKVRVVHESSRGSYGSPRIAAKLRQSGERVSENTVAKLMLENGLQARPRRRFKATTDSKYTERIADNLLKRNFSAEAPNRVWVTDVTAVWTLAGWVYLAAIVDLFSRRVVGWAMSGKNDTSLALSALDRALDFRKPLPGLIHHSDRGSPYGSDDYIARLDAFGIMRSMSRKGDCYDNSPAESLFSTLEFECRGQHTFHDLHDAQQVIGDYLDGFYNPIRIHSTIGYVSPIQFELASTMPRQAA